MLFPVSVATAESIVFLLSKRLFTYLLLFIEFRHVKYLLYYYSFFNINNMFELHLNINVLILFDFATAYYFIK